MAKSTKRLKIFSGSSNPQLTEGICNYLQMAPAKVRLERFPDGELDIQLQESVRGFHVVVVQSTCPPVDDNFMELFSMVDAIKRSQARSITAVIPYFGYARSDRRSRSKVPINAALMARLLEASGVQRVVLVDLHAGQEEAFFNTASVDHLTARPVLLDRLYDEDFHTWVAPDQGASAMVEEIAKADGWRRKVATVGKRRISGDQVDIRFILGREVVKGRRVMMFDDLVATGGTLLQGANALWDAGAISVDVCAVHAVFAGNALDKFRNAKRKDGTPVVRKIWVTNSIPLLDRVPKMYPKGKIEVVDLSKLIGEAILQIHTNGSVSQLFDREAYRAAVNGQLPNGSSIELDPVIDNEHEVSDMGTV